MRITEALEKGNEYAHRYGFVAVFLDGNGVVRWDATGQPPVALNYMVLDDWLPGKPEPEKCRACKEADELQFNPASMPVSADHLRRYHCTCKKEAP